MHLKVGRFPFLTIGSPGHVIKGRNGYNGEIKNVTLFFDPHPEPPIIGIIHSLSPLKPIHCPGSEEKGSSSVSLDSEKGYSSKGTDEALAAAANYSFYDLSKELLTPASSSSAMPASLAEHLNEFELYH